MPNARIDGIVAAASPVAVVFRRGPSKLWQQLVWNLDTDELASGQWLRGRIYTRRCDLSPDGRYLVGAYTNYSSRTEHKAHLGKEPWSHHGWTAVSRPPYFTAIGLWFTGGAWNGGGIWTSSSEVQLNNFAHHWETALELPREIKSKKLNLGPSEDDPIFNMLMKKRGWNETQAFESKVTNPDWRDYGKKLLSMFDHRKDFDLARIEEFLELSEKSMPKFQLIKPGRWTKRFARGYLERIDEGRGETWSIKTESDKPLKVFQIPSFGMQFLDIDHRGRVIFGEQGKLWTWDSCPDGQPTMVADLNAHTFENVKPPDWATKP